MAGTTITCKQPIDDATLVLLEYTTPRRCEECRVSLSSDTPLSDPQGRTKRARTWGVYQNEEVSELEFDKRYSVTADRRYVLFMVFPPVEPGVRTISIKEYDDRGSVTT